MYRIFYRIALFVIILCVIIFGIRSLSNLKAKSVPLIDEIVAIKLSVANSEKSLDDSIVTIYDKESIQNITIAHNQTLKTSKNKLFSNIKSPFLYIKIEYVLSENKLKIVKLEGREAYLNQIWDNVLKSINKMN